MELKKGSSSARFITSIVVSLIATATFTACSKDSDSTRQAPARIEQSLRPGTPAEPLTISRGDRRITLKKSSLGKAFMMSPTMTMAWSAPILDHLQTLVVVFERSGDQLGLYELNLQAFYGDLPADKLLHRFQIVSETSNDITFAWEYGLDFISQRSLGWGSDFPAGSNESPVEPTEVVFPIVTSFVREARVEGNSLSIEQVSRLRNLNFTLSMAALNTSQPVEVNGTDATIVLNFRITPYVLNPRFRARESELLDGIGFFENFSWNREQAREVIQADRWDFSRERGPVTYAITKNTPPAYAQAVKEGILYWNRVLGFEGIRVVTGVDPREEAQDRRVLVHWIDWEDAGFARASLQTDPLTGELLGGNVYMTSVFATGGRLSARVEARNRDRRFLALPGFRSQPVCDLTRDDVWRAELPAGERPSPAVVERAALDTIRSTVAHEVGHTLGLRHNFAGSLESGLSAAALDQAKGDYLEGRSTDGIATSSSVMDYIAGFETSLMGAYIQKNVLPYDFKAMEWGYLKPEASAASLKAPLFCTDGQVPLKDAVVVGCERFDSGPRPVAAKFDQARLQRDLVVARFARLVLSSWKDGGNATLEDLMPTLNALNLEERAKQSATVMTLRETFHKGTQHLRTRAELGQAGWLNQDQWTARNRELLKNELDGTGGLAGAIEALMPYEGGGLRKGWAMEQAERLIADPYFRQGTTIDGKPYQLTNEEASAFADLVRRYATKIEGLYALAAIKALSLDEKATATFDAEVVGSPADVPMLATGIIRPSDEARVVKVNEVDVSVPAPRHDLVLRQAALRWLSPKSFGPGWAFDFRGSLKAEQLRRLQLLGATGETAATIETSIKTLTLSPEAKTWSDTEIAVLKGLEALDRE